MSLPDGGVHTSDRIRGLVVRMICKFEEKFGSGVEGTLFDEHKTRGPRNARKGIPRKAFVCSALDPRTKSLPSLGMNDKMRVWDAVHADLCNEIKKTRMSTRKESDEFLANNNEMIRAKSSGDFFEEFFNDPDINEDEITGDLPVEIVAINELNAYKRLRTLPFKDNKNKYNDPLEWWKINELAMPFLAKLARETLNVPATSAPSERVFSSAGIYVNKRRAKDSAMT